jgi:hypothetical protein
MHQNISAGLCHVDRVARPIPRDAPVTRAVYWKDLLLSNSDSSFAARAREDLKYGLRHAQNSVKLLDLSVLGLRADPALPYSDVYAVDFLGHGVLYNIGYLMAKAVAEQDGPQQLATSLKQPPYQFILRYTQLTKYGADGSHPKLGPHDRGSEPSAPPDVT